MSSNEEKVRKFRLLKIIGYFISISFPYLQILSLNRDYKIVNEIVKGKDKRIKKQILKNRILALLFFLPIFIGTISFLTVFFGNDYLVKANSFIFMNLMELNFSKVSMIIEKVSQSSKTVEDIYILRQILLFTLIINGILGWFVYHFHINKIYKNIIKKRMKEEGIIKEKEDIKLLVTNIGFLIDGTGKDNEDLVKEKIWEPLNMEYSSKEVMVHPKKKSLRWFPSRFKLKSKIEYDMK